WILEHRSAERLLFERDVTHTFRQRGQRSGEARRARADDDDIGSIAAAPAAAGLDGLDRLASLLERVANQTHSAELARDKDAWNVRLEFRGEHWYLDAATRGAEHQSDGLGRTGGLACAVTDAIRGTDELSATADDAEHAMQGLLRANLHARPATDASRWVDE